MAITRNGVTGKELWDTFKKGRNQSGPYADLSYMIEPGTQKNIDDFIDGVMGGVVVTGNPPNQSVKVLSPLNFFGNPKLWAVQAECTGAGESYALSAGGHPAFNAAVVAVHFEVPAWPITPADDPGGQQSFPNDNQPGEPILYADCEIDFGGDLITIPNTSLKFVSDDTPVDAPVARRVGVTTWRITRHLFPYLPHSQVRSLLNKVNDDTFMGCNIGTVLFSGAKTRQQRTSDGTKVQAWELEFQIREKNWNYYLRPDGLIWGAVCSKTDVTVLPFEYADLRPLLAPANLYA